MSTFLCNRWWVAPPPPQTPTATRGIGGGAAKAQPYRRPVADLQARIVFGGAR